MRSAVRNWFATPWVAPRYVAGRPDVHTGIALRLRDRIAAEGALERALDVGCGTGLSTRALRHLARVAFGLDPSPTMLREASPAARAHYARGRAEALPFGDGAFELVTIGCAWHWCEPGPFLSEVARVLRPGGWLVVYDSEFRGASDDPGLHAWLRERYWSRLVRVGRRDYFDPDRLCHASLESVGREELEQIVPMTLAQVRTLITSQASTAGNVEMGTLTLGEAEAALDAGLAPFFPAAGGPRAMRFVAPLAYVRRRP